MGIWAVVFLLLGSVGYYSNGSLQSDARITGGEAGLFKLFPDRDRGYGNPELIRLLTSLGIAYNEEFPSPYERIHLGDLSQKGGGKITRHASHQNGLDVDVGYLRRDLRESDPQGDPENGFDEVFVVGGRVTENFDTARNWWVLRWLVATGRIDRIFVAKEIKKHFCDQSRLEETEDPVMRAEVLRLLRPWPNHADHFHVRMECPVQDEKCIGSLPVPPGTGCDDQSLNENDGAGLL